MMMNFRRSQCHRAPHIFYAQPSSVEIRGFLEFRDNAKRALRNHLRDELVSVKQSTANGDEQTARTGAPRVMADVRYYGVLVAGQRCASRFGNLFESWGLVYHGVEFYAGSQRGRKNTLIRRFRRLHRFKTLTK